MSSSHLQEYVRDVPMDLGINFYPLPRVNVPDISIQKPNFPVYNFENERKAVLEYEKDRSSRAAAVAQKALPSESSAVNAVPAESSTRVSNLRKVHSADILEPSLVAPSGPSRFSMRNSATNAKATTNSFEEFEVKPNLFDLLELHTIDDKAALEQILSGSTSSTSTAFSETSRDANTVNKSSAVPSATDNRISSRASSCPSAAQPESTNDRSLRFNGDTPSPVKQLAAKGYPEMYIRQCVKALPVHLQPQIESYVRGVMKLSQLGADSDCALTSLIRLNFVDESRIHSFVDAAVQLCTLGFGINSVMDALCVCGARRDAALERLLQQN